MKLHVFATKHKANTYHHDEHLIRYLYQMNLELTLTGIFDLVSNPRISNQFTDKPPFIHSNSIIFFLFYAGNKLSNVSK